MRPEFRGNLGDDTLLLIMYIFIHNRCINPKSIFKWVFVLVGLEWVNIPKHLLETSLPCQLLKVKWMYRPELCIDLITHLGLSLFHGILIWKWAYRHQCLKDILWFREEQNVNVSRRWIPPMRPHTDYILHDSHLWETNWSDLM